MKIAFFVAFLFLIASCSKGEGMGDINDLPQSILAQIRDAEQDCPTCGIKVDVYKYNNEMIYGVTCLGHSASEEASCFCTMVFYDIAGQLVKYDQETYEKIHSGKILIKEVYRCIE